MNEARLTKFTHFGQRSQFDSIRTGSQATSGSVIAADWLVGLIDHNGILDLAV